MTFLCICFPVTPAQNAVTHVCEAEVLEITCPTNQVIMVDNAKYGRMELGRCISKDYGYIGCVVDVTDILIEYCHGQSQCAFNVPQRLLLSVNPCPRDLQSYLEISYTCQENTQAPSGEGNVLLRT